MAVKLSIILMFIFSINAMAGWLDPFSDKVSEGNNLFKEKKYGEARRSYSEAEKDASSAEERKRLSFNKGDADYMSGNNGSAMNEYRDALTSEDPEVRKKGYFNLGNSLLKEGKKREAAESYMNALKIDPGYEKAKKNIEYILKHKNDKNRQQDNRQKSRDGSGGEAGNDKNEENKNDASRSMNSAGKERGKHMDRDQVKNIFESMKDNPVRRQKGSGKGRRELEKNW